MKRKLKNILQYGGHGHIPQLMRFSFGMLVISFLFLLAIGIIGLCIMFE